MSKSKEELEEFKALLDEKRSFLVPWGMRQIASGVERSSVSDRIRFMLKRPLSEVKDFVKGQEEDERKTSS